FFPLCRTPGGYLLLAVGAERRSLRYRHGEAEQAEPGRKPSVPPGGDSLPLPPTGLQTHCGGGKMGREAQAEPGNLDCQKRRNCQNCHNLSRTNFQFWRLPDSGNFGNLRSPSPQEVSWPQVTLGWFEGFPRPASDPLRCRLLRY